MPATSLVAPTPRPPRQSNAAGRNCGQPQVAEEKMWAYFAFLRASAAVVAKEGSATLNGDGEEAGKGVTIVMSTAVGPTVKREESRRSAGRSLPDMVTAFWYGVPASCAREARVSRRALWRSCLLTFWQASTWSPKASTVRPQVGHGRDVAAASTMGRPSRRATARENELGLTSVCSAGSGCSRSHADE